MSNPPRNTSENCKTLGGNGTSSIEVFGAPVISAIRMMKKRPRRYGDMAIAEDINSTILADSEDKISHMAIHRWWKKHRDDDDYTDNMVNIYGSNLESLNSLTKQMNIVEVYLEELNSNVSNVDEVVKVSKEVNELMRTYDKLSMRKSALLGTIGDIQAKVCTYENMTTIVDRVMSKVKDKDPKMHMELLMEFEADNELREMFRQIKPLK